MAYPLFVLFMLYGQWLLSSIILGHLPVPSLEDPKFISGAGWMHGFTGLALLGIFPAAGLAITLNPLYVINHRFSLGRAALRAMAVLAVWIASYLFLVIDPFGVLYWWFD